MDSAEKKGITEPKVEDPSQGTQQEKGQNGREIGTGSCNPLAGAVGASDASGNENGDGGAAKVHVSADAVAGSGDEQRGRTDNPAGLGTNGIPRRNPRKPKTVRRYNGRPQAAGQQPEPAAAGEDGSSGFDQNASEAKEPSDFIIIEDVDAASGDDVAAAGGSEGGNGDGLADGVNKGSAKQGKATKFIWKKVINPGIGATKYIDCLRQAMQEQGLDHSTEKTDFRKLLSRLRDLIKEAGGNPNCVGAKCAQDKVGRLRKKERIEGAAQPADAPKPNGSGGDDGSGLKRAREQQVETPGQPSSVHPVLKRRRTEAALQQATGINTDGHAATPQGPQPSPPAESPGPAKQPPRDAASDTRYTWWEPRLDERMYTQAGLEAAAARIALIENAFIGEVRGFIGVEEATDALAQALEKQAVADKARSEAAVACVDLDEAFEQQRAELSKGKAGVLAAARAAPPRVEVQETFKAPILEFDNAMAAVQECREQLASGAVAFTLEDVQQIHPTLGEPAKAFLDRRAAALKAEAEALEAAASMESLRADVEARTVRFNRIVRAGEAQVKALRAKGMGFPIQQLRILLGWSRGYLRRLPEEQQLAAVEAAVAMEPSLMDDLKSHFLSVCTEQRQRGPGNEVACAFMMELAGFMFMFP